MKNTSHREERDQKLDFRIVSDPDYSLNHIPLWMAECLGKRIHIVRRRIKILNYIWERSQKTNNPITIRCSDFVKFANCLHKSSAHEEIIFLEEIGLIKSYREKRKKYVWIDLDRFETTKSPKLLSQENQPQIEAQIA